jgi:hypothetical protein
MMGILAPCASLQPRQLAELRSRSSSYLSSRGTTAGRSLRSGPTTRDERYAEWMRQRMHRAKGAIGHHVHGVSGQLVDAVQEGVGLQRCFLAGEFTENIVRRTLRDLIPDDEPDGAADPARRHSAMIRREMETT